MPRPGNSNGFIGLYAAQVPPGGKFVPSGRVSGALNVSGAFIHAEYLHSPNGKFPNEIQSREIPGLALRLARSFPVPDYVAPLIFPNEHYLRALDRKCGTLSHLGYAHLPQGTRADDIRNGSVVFLQHHPWELFYEANIAQEGIKGLGAGMLM